MHACGLYMCKYSIMIGNLYLKFTKYAKLYVQLCFINLSKFVWHVDCGLLGCDTM
jgi:hypothetical protein